jgi:hypothetical protein
LICPEIVCVSGDEFHLSCRDGGGIRIGYFVGNVIGGKVLIRTFLFLTMQGTPESKLLYQRLGVRRADIERLGLDELATYLYTDLGDDEQLARILTDCGCGGLLELRNTWNAGGSKRECARQIRAHLRIRESPAKGILTGGAPVADPDAVSAALTRPSGALGAG